MFNAFPYLGKPEECGADADVLNFMKPLFKKEYGVTTNNFFIS